MLDIWGVNPAKTPWEKVDTKLPKALERAWSHGWHDTQTDGPLVVTPGLPTPQEPHGVWGNQG